MTDLVSRPPRPPRSPAARRPAPPRRPPRADAPQSVSLAGVLAALRAAALGLLTVMVLVLVAWATAADSGASATEAVAAGFAIWLVGHLARLSVPGGGFGLAPLGLTLLLAVLLYSSAVRAARAAQVRGRRAVGSLTVALAASYAAIAVVISLFARSAAVQPRPVTVFLGAGGLALIAGGAGAVRGSGRAVAWWSRIPTAGRLALTGAAGAVCVLLASGSLLVCAMLALHRGEVSGVVSGLDAGTSGTLLVLLICVLYAPTAVVWGTSYLVGPGFAVGTGTTVAISGVHLGAVPAVPLLAALPSSRDTGAAWPLMVAATLAAGLVSGVLVDPGRRAGIPGSRSLVARPAAGRRAHRGGHRSGARRTRRRIDRAGRAGSAGAHRAGAVVGGPRRRGHDSGGRAAILAGRRPELFRRAAR